MNRAEFLKLPQGTIVLLTRGGTGVVRHLDEETRIAYVKVKEREVKMRHTDIKSAVTSPKV